MDVLVKIRTFRPLKSRLLLCEHIRSGLAEEVLSHQTPKPRRVEALVERAAVQTKTARLAGQLEKPQAGGENLYNSALHLADAFEPFLNLRNDWAGSQ